MQWYFVSCDLIELFTLILVVTKMFRIQCWIVHLTMGKEPVGLSPHADSVQNINSHCRTEAWKRNSTWELQPPKPIHLLGSVYSTDTLLLQPRPHIAGIDVCLYFRITNWQERTCLAYNSIWKLLFAPYWGIKCNPNAKFVRDIFALHSFFFFFFLLEIYWDNHPNLIFNTFVD